MENAKQNTQQHVAFTGGTRKTVTQQHVALTGGTRKIVTQLHAVFTGGTRINSYATNTLPSPVVHTKQSRNNTLP